MRVRVRVRDRARRRVRVRAEQEDLGARKRLGQKTERLLRLEFKVRDRVGDRVKA